MQKHIVTPPTKAWLCLFIVGLLLTLAACGAAPTAGGTTTPTAAATPTTNTAATVIAFTTPTTAPTTAPSGGGNSIALANFAFAPSSLTVKVGTKVTWTNNDSATHTVTADQGAFDSKDLPPGQSYSFTFTKAGTYAYHCAIHPSMTATVVVQ